VQSLLLNVAAIRRHSRVNGPGMRSVVWVQGCSIRCPGCLNRHTHPHETVQLVDPQRLARQLLEVRDIDGLTLSGGEPFEQAEACAVLAATYRASGRSVMVYSGYTFCRLSASKNNAVRDFLEQIDLLVAGPYVRHLACDGHLWRGSTNQTVHLLTDKLRHRIDFRKSSGAVVEVNTDGRLASCMGFPEQADLAWLKRLTNRTLRASAGGPCRRRNARSCGRR
jgi:anaerobic ribonucleoside-triphosphate reductase activating protein